MAGGPGPSQLGTGERWMLQPEKDYSSKTPQGPVSILPKSPVEISVFQAKAPQGTAVPRGTWKPGAGPGCSLQDRLRSNPHGGWPRSLAVGDRGAMGASARKRLLLENPARSGQHPAQKTRSKSVFFRQSPLRERPSHAGRGNRARVRAAHCRTVSVPTPASGPWRAPGDAPPPALRIH